MKKKTILIAGGILMVLLSVFIYSCKKDYKEAIDESVSSSLLESAQDWHAKQTQITTTLSNGKKRSVLQPQWKEARMHQSPNGTEIITPSPNYPLGSKSEMDVIRKFVFKVDGDKVTDGNIIEIYAEAKAMKGKKANLFEKYRDGNMENFTGAVLIYDVNYKIIKNEVYVNGIKNKGTAYLIGKRGQQTSSKNGKPITTLDYWSDCYPVYLEWGTYTWDDLYEMPEITIHTKYLFDICFTYNENSEYGGGDYPPAPPDDGGCSSCGGCSIGSVKNGVRCGNSTPPPPPPPPTPLPAIFVNNVQNPCLSGMVNSIIGTNANINNKVNTMIQAIFNRNANTNLYFTDQHAISTPDRDAETVSQLANGKFNSVIKLRESVLANSSKEFIAATILHEALHAYMDENNINMTSDQSHEQMVEDYLTTIADTLKSMFPNLTDDYAYSLAWGGLEGTAWFTFMNQLNMIPPYQSEINQLLRAHTVINPTTGQTQHFGHGC